MEQQACECPFLILLGLLFPHATYSLVYGCIWTYVDVYGMIITYYNGLLRILGSEIYYCRILSHCPDGNRFYDLIIEREMGEWNQTLASVAHWFSS